MVFKNRKSSGSNEDDPWEMVGDDLGGAEGAPSLEEDAPCDANKGGSVGGVSSVIRDDRPSDADGEQGDTLDEDQETVPSTSQSPESPANGVHQPLEPIPSMVTEEPDAAGAPFAASTPAAEGAKPRAPTPPVHKSSNSPTASPLEASGEGSSEEEEKSEKPGLVDSLSGMGFEKERVEKAIATLREAGSGIDIDAVVGAMVGESSVGGRAWDFLQSTARDFERQHELRLRTQNCAKTVGDSAREVLYTAKGESRRFGASFRETCDEADVRARTASTQVQCAASSAKDSLCRANEEHGILEKVATAAVVGGALLLALGNPRAGMGALAVAGSSVAAGEAVKHSPAHSTSTRTRDHGLREGLHLD